MEEENGELRCPPPMLPRQEFGPSLSSHPLGPSDCPSARPRLPPSHFWVLLRTPWTPSQLYPESLVEGQR